MPLMARSTQKTTWGCFSHLARISLVNAGWMASAIEYSSNSP